MLRKSRDIIRRLEKDGWVLKNTKKHHVFSKPGHRNNIVPNHPKDLTPGTIADIYRVAGWPKD